MATRAAFALLVAAACVAGALAGDCNGTPNSKPLWTDAPVLVKTVTNGALYQAGNQSVPNPLHVVQVFGTPYEMGYAYGELMKPQIVELIDDAYEYFQGMIGSVIGFLPKSWQKPIEDFGIEVAIGLTYDLTKDYIPDEFMQEMYGMSNATGIEWQKIMGIAVFPEIIKAGCSMFGAWNNATMTSRDGALVQLRALDWTTNGPFQKFPVVVVYHPEADNGHAFASMSWAGFIGSITGYSSVELGLCEKVWLNYKGKSSRSGRPFTMVLRDILQYDNSVEDAVKRIHDANRTCSIFVGVGDAKENTFRGIEYSYEQVNVYDDQDFPAYPPYHDKMDGLVFFDKHTQPSHDPCLNDLLQKHYGNIDAEVTFREITPVFQTGDMHVAIYDFAKHTMTVANALPSINGTNGAPAYDQQFTQLDMKAIFAVTKPSA